MRYAIDHESAHPANSLAAIVVERDRLFAPIHQAFIQDIQHLQKRHVRIDVVGLIANRSAGVAGRLLPPHVQDQSHSRKLRIIYL